MRPEAVPPPLLFVVSAVSQYAGAALAVRAFEVMPAPGVAWMRVVIGAAVLCAWRRPWRMLRDRVDVAVVVLFGAALAGMNLCFYLAIDRLPLGSAVAIEFIGPVAVAAIAARGARNVAALLLAVTGVIALSRVTPGGGGAGLAFALAAGALWALYIVLAHAVARRNLGTAGLAAGMAAGAVVIAPLAAAPAVRSLGNATAVLLCVGVAVLSSVIPYALDQVVLRRLDRGAFALLLSLLPATATLTGMVALRQIPSPLEAAGIVLVVAAVAVRRPE